MNNEQYEQQAIYLKHKIDESYKMLKPKDFFKRNFYNYITKQNGWIEGLLVGGMMLMFAVVQLSFIIANTRIQLGQEARCIVPGSPCHTTAIAGIIIAVLGLICLFAFLIAFAVKKSELEKNAKAYCKEMKKEVDTNGGKKDQ